MCGFVAAFDGRGERNITPHLLRKMTRTLKHRGPDGEGYHIDAGIALGHSRLSIIDIDGGSQPMSNEERTIFVVFNGEIYNYVELTHALEKRGHRFRTQSDTEVLIHAWAEWGPDCVVHLRGMFAFALWDARQKTLFVARDRLGIKPVFMSLLPDGTLVCASELKAITAHPGFTSQLDLSAIEDFLTFGYIPDPKTIYRHAQKLEPGHTFVWRRGGECLTRRYWNVGFHQHKPGSLEDACTELRQLLDDAVRIHLVADVGIGAFLSGGLDSSAVVSSMAALTQHPIQTCSIGFDQTAFDETHYARMVSNKYDTQQYERSVSALAISRTSRGNLAATINGIYDEPFGDSSAIPTLQLCEIARKRVKVALSGDGGDEVFAGYRRYLLHVVEDSIRKYMPAPLRHPIFSFLARIYPKMDWAPRPLRAKTTFYNISRLAHEAYFRSVSISDHHIRTSLYTDCTRRHLNGYSAQEIISLKYKAAQTDDPLQQIRYVDLHTYLPGDILTKVDRASMAHSLEVRVPLLDHKLVEWAIALPSCLLMDNRGKRILRHALRDRLPPSILNRKKMGFSVPLSSWLRGPFASQIENLNSGSNLVKSGLFEEKSIENLRRSYRHHHRDHSALLWCLLILENHLERSTR